MVACNIVSVSPPVEKWFSLHLFVCDKIVGSLKGATNAAKVGDNEKWGFSFLDFDVFTNSYRLLVYELEKLIFWLQSFIFVLWLTLECYTYRDGNNYNIADCRKQLVCEKPDNILISVDIWFDAFVQLLCFIWLCAVDS